MNTIKGTALFLLFVSLSTYANTASFVMRITCAPCSISCGFTNCYKMAASDGSYSEEICSTTDCPSNYNQNMTV